MKYLRTLSDPTYKGIISSINLERFHPFQEVTVDDLRALKLYSLNAELSCMLHELIGGFEISLRNNVSDATGKHFLREDWYRCQKFTRILSSERRANLKEVRHRLKAAKKDETSGRVISGLTFNFWVALHEGKYRDVFWTPYLREVWPEGENIKHVRADLMRIRDLRNRIAHHEPIFSDRWRTKPETVWKRLFQVAPEKCDWLKVRLDDRIKAVIVEIETLLSTRE